MNKYELLIKKIQTLKVGKCCSSPYYLCRLNKVNLNLNQEELALIEEALETIQFLEIVFKARNKKLKDYEKP